jgi:pyridoxal 5'-phosphate synthase pdxT subunit
MMKAGVLALQGDFREHAEMLEACGATPVLVRTPDQLATVDVLALPGGESTAMSKLARQHGLVEPLRERARAGMPIFGTCAGMILMARKVIGGDSLLGVVDIAIERNAYGRQVDSFEADLEVTGVGPVRGVFIRAPVVTEVGSDVEILAEYGGRPAVVRQRRLIASAFHPEIAGDPRLHRLLLDLAADRNDP